MPDTIGERLHRIRRERGLSLQQLADRSGVAKSVLSYVESGARPGSGLTLASAVKLARTLSVSLDVLAGTWERETTPEPGEPAAMHPPGKDKRPRRRTAASVG